MAGRPPRVQEEARHGEDALDEDQVDHHDRRAHADQGRGRGVRERTGMAADDPLVRHALRDRGPHVIGVLLLPEQRDDEPQAHRRERRRRHEPRARAACGTSPTATRAARPRSARHRRSRAAAACRTSNGTDRSSRQPEDVHRRAVQGRWRCCSTTRARREPERAAHHRPSANPAADADRHRSQQHRHVGGVAPRPHLRARSGSRASRTPGRSRSGRTPGPWHAAPLPRRSRRRRGRAATSAGWPAR